MILAMNHVGISVANLERSIQFYRDLFGMELFVEEKFGGERYSQILGLKGAAGRVALLKTGKAQIELFEFAAPTPRPGDPARPVCDHGITHLCFEVADLKKEYDRLRAAGVTFHCPPLDFDDAGSATYARDPDGNVVELIQLPTRPQS